MKYPLSALLSCCLVAAGAHAQHRGGGANVGFSRGGIRAGGLRTAGGGRYLRRGYANFGRRAFRGFYRPFWSSYLPWLYGYPGSWDWSDYDSEYPYANSYENAPNVTVVYGPPAQPAYPTVINLTAHPVMHEYHQTEDYGLPSAHGDKPVLYLIAFNDHIIRAATTYWVENGKLYYLDLDHKRQEASLSSVDRDFSAQLNRERHVPFGL